MKPTHKQKSKPRNFFSYLWNEFLFARQFEYESPVTPDEITQALEDLQGERYQSTILSRSSLIYDVTVEGDSEKERNFRIEIDDPSLGKWLTSRLSMLYAQGQMRVNSDTGMTDITGLTRFSGTYYGVILFIVIVNLITQSMQSNLVSQILPLIFISVFWFSMYRARNRLADRIDMIIMTAKSEVSHLNLVDSHSDNDLTDNTLPQNNQSSNS